MRQWRDVLLVFLYLVLAFGGEFFSVWLFPGILRDPYLNVLPMVVLFAGLGLAFWTAREAHRKAGNDGRPAGLYCKVCGYDLRKTVERCPECGGVDTGVYRGPWSRQDRWWEASAKFIGIATVAVIAAGVILVHVQVMALPMGGGH